MPGKEKSDRKTQIHIDCTPFILVQREHISKRGSETESIVSSQAILSELEGIVSIIDIGTYILSTPGLWIFPVKRSGIISEFRTDVEKVIDNRRAIRDIPIGRVVSIPVIFCIESSGHVLVGIVSQTIFKSNVGNYEKPVKRIRTDSNPLSPSWKDRGCN